MNARRILGVVLLIVGAVVLVLGLQASGSVADKVSETFTGRYTRETTTYIVGGLASAVLGILLIFFGGARR